MIRAGTLIDGVSEAPRRNQLIFVRGEKITKVTGSGEAIPSGANVIDLSNTTVLPGLIDSHTHIFLWGEDPAKGGYDENILKAGIALRAARATAACRRALEQGFTTLRDVETEGAGYGDVEIKQAIEEGTIPGPRLFCATRAIPGQSSCLPRGAMREIGWRTFPAALRFLLCLCRNGCNLPAPWPRSEGVA